ncbi:uncharacterized protein LOC143893117 isoform X2 [Tasmannia lanceolata]|uniref:uncharacterized protein LOC143893117 isoform X2 n=1 Tax=Tasmannia lanceolata TaxID=3420 RepID=UPI00406462B5
MRTDLLSHIHEFKTLRPFVSAAKITCQQDLRGQTVAVIGLGVSGRAAVKLALARGASVIAVDKNKQLLPLESECQFAEHTNLRTVLGDFDRKFLENSDRVVVSPGVPLENYGLSALLQSVSRPSPISIKIQLYIYTGKLDLAYCFVQGRVVMSELDFSAEVLPSSIKILAVTGTNGKSTVSTFAAQMLHQLGIKAFVGGNLGNPLSEAAIQCLESYSGKEIFQVAVVEVSSYQMEIPNQYFCPSVAVVLNLTPDHLERHKTMWNYAVTKCRVFSHMNNNKLALLPAGNQHLREAFRDHMDKCNVAWIGDLPGVEINMESKVANLIIPTSGLITQLPLGGMKAMGTHNYHNAAVAAFSVLGLDIGIDADSIYATIESLNPPPHRMQIVYRDDHGVTWVDDSKATNVEATYAGLMGLKEQKSVVLLGGLAKESSGFEQLVEPLKCHRGVITFGASGMMIQKVLRDGGLTIACVRATNLEDAVSFARSMASYGDAIVLSPGCASFDEFRNFEHRGKVFQDLAFSVH